ncbi:MAG: phage shock protein operon transcriptional activator, partial [Alphaproteobacteria bacterium]|nr:phage shock protein operon transcriptional activator [Alphaproteobacteria bacterium]
HLPEMVAAGKFRADLLDRLAFEVITLPPLKAREGDIELLADHFGRRMAAELDWPKWVGFSAVALAAMVAHDWPGNVRELRNLVERAVYRWDPPGTAVGAIQLDPFDSVWRPGTVVAYAPPARTIEAAPGPAPAPAAPITDLRAAISNFEHDMLTQTLIRHRHNQRATAKALNLSYDQLRHALRRHGLISPAMDA